MRATYSPLTETKKLNLSLLYSSLPLRSLRLEWFVKKPEPKHNLLNI